MFIVEGECLAEDQWLDLSNPCLFPWLAHTGEDRCLAITALTTLAQVRSRNLPLVPASQPGRNKWDYLSKPQDCISQFSSM